MNYYQYKRRAPRSRATDFIKPFLVIIIFIAIIVAGWKLLGSTFTGDQESLSSEKIFLDIETGSAKAMTSGSNEWKSVPNGIYLYEGEKLRTQSDGRVTLSFFDKDKVRLDKSSELEFKTLEREAGSGAAGLILEDGRLWLEIDESGTSSSTFTIETGLLSLVSDGGVFAVSHPGMLYVLEGSVKAEIMHEGDIIKSTTIGVGQELIIDAEIAADLSEGLQKEIIFALDDAFKSSNWHRWNKQQGDNTFDDLTDESEVESDEQNIESDEESETDEPETEIADDEETEEEEVDEDDQEPPTKPQIEEPGNNGDTITLDSGEQDITGSVSSDTEAVIVNDYRLSKYVPGSKTFRYTAKVEFGNLEVGENEFEVIAVDKNQNKSEVAKITLLLSQEVYDEIKSEEEDEEDSEVEVSTPAAASSTGGVSITSPNNGENLVTSETAFEIKGSVPEGTSKVLVNGYQLQGFTEGSSTFLYRANSTLGTLEIGELNTYTVKAYGADDEVIGEASMTIDVESGSNGEGAPVISIPTSAGTYETTLDQIVLGGSVGKWITRVRIDGTNLDTYIPGSEEWKKTITLAPGSNVFEVCAEKEGESQGCSTISINYQN